MPLKTTYKNDVYSGLRKYQKTDNPDGTLSLEDVTQYSVQGDNFGADDINAINIKINELDARKPLPDGGTTGQVLTKTTEGATWKDLPTPQSITKTLHASSWTSSNTITVSASEIKPQSKITITTVTQSSVDSSFKTYIEDLKNASIIPLTQGSGFIKLFASGQKPNKDLRIQLIIE